MPFLLPAAATAVAAAAPAAAATTAAATAGATLTSIATNIAMNVAISAVMSALQPQVGTGGRSWEWTLSPDGPIPFAAGRIGVPGAAVHKATFGPDLMYYGIPSVLSGAGPIDGYETFKADDELVTFDANGKAISSQYANELWFRRTMGNQPDVAVTSPPGLKNNATLPGWGAQHKLSGKAAYMVVMGENSKGTAFPTGEIKPLITLRGLKGWDPRLDSTWPGGDGPCRLDNPATWVYLRRPGLWGLKWALGLWEGPTLKGAPAHGSATDYQVGGIGAKLSGIDVAAFVNLENICDANDWTVSAYPTTDDDKFAVLESFLQAGGAAFAMRAGKISCIQRAAPRASIVTISAADTAGPLEIDTAASRIDRINTIRPRIMSEPHRWQMTAIAEVSAQTYRDQDGGVRPRGIDYTYVSNATQGAQLAALQIANTREGIAGVIPLKPHLQKIKPGDAFTITEPGFVLNGLKCLCLSTEFDPSTKIVAVSFVSETDAKYPFALGQSQEPPEPPVLEPEDHTVTPPSALEWSLASVNFTDGGVTIPALVLSGVVDNAVAQMVVFEYRPVGAETWAFAGAEDPTVVRKEITAVTAGTQYEAAISYRIGGRISTRLVLGPVTAGTLTAGDVSPITPANVAGTPSLAITTTILPDGTQTSRLYGDWAEAADAASYLVEFNDGTLTWTEPAAESGVTEKIVVTGPSYRYRVKAVSRTGHVSAVWSNWSATVAAGGDTTAPGVVTAPSVTALARRNVIAFTLPADDDLSHVRLYRNTTGGAHAEADLYHPQVTGSIFTDTNVQANVSYYYAARTVDRTGNVGVFRFLGLGTPSYIRLITGGGGPGSDINPTDTDLVTINGVSAGFTGQTAWATFGGSTGRVANLSDAGAFNSLANVTTRALSLLTGRTADNITYLTGGATVDSLRPGEAGANVTESRTAAGFTGQTAWATYGAHTPADIAPRVAAGLTGNGDLARNIPGSILTGSNVLQRLGGGTFTGDLAATLGARAGANLFRADGATVMTQAEVRTAEGQAASFFGQGALATQNTVTPVQLPPASVSNFFLDENFTSGLVGLANGAAFDTSAETTATLGVPKSIKSPDGAGKAAGSQTQFTTFNAANAPLVAAGQYVRFTGLGLIKAGFTGMLRAFFYFTGPTGGTVGGPAVVMLKDCRAVAQAVTEVVSFDTQVLVPAGATACYFVFIIDWSATQPNAGYALIGKPGLRVVADFGSLTSNAVRLGSNVRRNNGTTLVNDADAITSLGVASSVTGQTSWATYSAHSPVDIAPRVAAGLSSNGDVARPIPTPILDGSNVLRRAGGGEFTGDLDAVSPAFVDNSVGTLENDLISGVVVPATFAGKGALAEKDMVGSGDVTQNSILAPLVVAPAGTVTTAGAISSSSYVLVFSFEITTGGEPLLFMPSFLAKFWHPGGGDFSITLRFIRLGGGVLRPDVVINAINGDQYHGWQTPWFSETPPAGTHTYEVRAWASTDAGFTHRDFSDRQMLVLRLPTSTL